METQKKVKQITLNRLERLLPEYRKLDKRDACRKEVFFSRKSELSHILVAAEMITKKRFLPEMHSCEDIDFLYSLENEKSCIVDFGDVEFDGALYRYYIAKEQLREVVRYFLCLDICQIGKMIRLMAFGDECGQSFLRRDVHEREYRKNALAFFGSESVTTGCDFIYRTRKKGCCYVISENPIYDSLYPEHPLSQLRLLVKKLMYKGNVKVAI